MDSPKKQANSVKHLEFLLQREKNTSKELNDKCKEFQRQIAQLEQDKAELRRERIMAADDGKRCEKLEERIHALQRELESKDQSLAAEKIKSSEAAAETDRVRHNAEVAIASWTSAETQWVAEQEKLNALVVTLRGKLKESEDSSKVVKLDLELLKKSLQKEKDLTRRLESSLEESQNETQSYREQSETLRHRISELEQSVYNLDLAGDKQKEALVLKDTEIKMLESTIARLKDNEEKMEQTISALNDRVSAAKLANIDAKGENEKLQCDLAEQRKEIQRLNMQLDSLRKETSLASTSQSSLHKSLEDAKEKCRNYQDQIKEKSVELRNQELTITQLRVDIQRKENGVNELTFRCSSLEKDLEQCIAEKKTLSQTIKELEETVETANEEIKKLQLQAESREEQIILMQSTHADEIDELKAELKRCEEEGNIRAALLNDLTSQLGETSSQNQMYQNRILEESDTIKTCRAEIRQLGLCIQEKDQQIFTEQCMTAKYRVFASTAEDLFTDIISALSSGHRTQTTELSSRISDTDANLAAAKVQIAEQESVILAHTATITELQKSLSECHQKLSTTEAALEEREATVQMANASSAERMRNLSHLAAAQIQHVNNLGSLFENSTVEKIALFSCAAESIQNTLASACHSSGAEMESLRSKNAELSLFVKEAKETMNGRNMKLMCRLQELTDENESLKKKTECVQTENAKLCEEIERDKSYISEVQQQCFQKITEIEKKAETECALLRTECNKLRNGVEYEVKRKCEYKAALEELKELRKQSEMNREKEKELASAAIEKANREIKYWVYCFEKLKGIVEHNHKKYGIVPAVAPDVSQRLAAIRGLLAKNDNHKTTTVDESAIAHLNTNSGNTTTNSGEPIQSNALRGRSNNSNADTIHCEKPKSVDQMNSSYNVSTSTLQPQPLNTLSGVGSKRPRNEDPALFRRVPE